MEANTYFRVRNMEDRIYYPAQYEIDFSDHFWKNDEHLIRRNSPNARNRYNTLLDYIVQTKKTNEVIIHKVYPVSTDVITESLRLHNEGCNLQGLIWFFTGTQYVVFYKACVMRELFIRLIKQGFEEV